MRYVNLGCGSRFHPEWINIDCVPQGAGVIAHDLRRGIPLPDRSCDAVYHSNLLEHFRQTDALPFMRDCYRVLKPSGILRIGVPDLERICRVYLEKLEAARAGDAASVYDYEWIMLELHDQTVREQSGGGMLAYLQQDPIPNEAFVYERIGEEGRQLIRNLQCPPPLLARYNWRTRLRQLRWYLRRLPEILRTQWSTLLLSSEARRALEIGRFRLLGEVHHWMYDSYSLARLILAVGFRDPIQQKPGESRIAGWPRFHLDTLSDGTVIKPDSLFMEAVKPESG